MDDALDTETLLACVRSLLNRTVDNQDIILDALVQCDGDASKAAELLNSKGQTEAEMEDTGTRKRARGLDDWLRNRSSRKVAKKDAKRGVEIIQRSSTADVSPMDTASTASSEPRASNLMSILQQPPSPKKVIPQKPPLTLGNPSMVAKHTPCTLHLSVLPAELASRLFHTMTDASHGWKRNKWWLFERIVESPHRTSFFARRTDGIDKDASWQQAAQFWYNGRPTDPPEVFPPPMEEACEIIERLVSDELRKRPRLPLEWPGVPDDQDGLLWRANVAASNCYEGRNESVGWHSDQMTYLGPMCTIASLSLGTQRNFSLREVIPAHEAQVRRAQTFNIPLPHNSLIIMHASCQERFKHSVPPQSSMDLFRPAHPRTPGAPIEPSNCRINVTFRFYRPDFRPPSIPRCKCDAPMILRPDMKHRSHESVDRYWWACYAGAQNDGKGCNMWKIMDMAAEKRGSLRIGVPVIKSTSQ
ncbi:grf zinc finger family protein [Moniliophthora roreri MCA 2997]|uniref:Grf zinc finger family protein n=1 Tax=Moniliophthora roreri (strain MCA 2997) TaxID=1381753 RepID=V2XJ20_MONRO|nr:grf zinc finger family protein [Moniliophthora roreri MCA 2997]